MLSRAINAYSTPSAPLAGTAQLHRTATYMCCLRCAGAPSDPRVVPRFCLSILPSMSSSTSPGSRPLHVSSSFAVRVCLRRGVIGSALPMLAISGLTGSPLLRPAELLASLTGDFYFRAFTSSVILPVAGYDYGGNWTISTGGTHTRWTDD